jgi:hypothetical protein
MKHESITIDIRPYPSFGRRRSISEPLCAINRFLHDKRKHLENLMNLIEPISARKFVLLQSF